MSTTQLQHVLVNETKAEYEYDPETALRLWHTLVAEIPEYDNRGYTEYDNLTDEGRIINLFELLCGSQFGDMIFGSVGNDDQGSRLIARRWDE